MVKIVTGKLAVNLAGLYSHWYEICPAIIVAMRLTPGAQLKRYWIILRKSSKKNRGTIQSSSSEEDKKGNSVQICW